MKRKFNQSWLTISTNINITKATSYLKQLNAKRPWHMALKIQVLAMYGSV
jgi:hypothetical protein